MKNFMSLPRNLAPMSAAFLLGFALSACSTGIGDTEVELNGKVFDMMGITSSGAKTRPNTTARAPLVLPPDGKKLPVPGQRPGQSVDLAWPDDPDAQKIRLAKQAAKKKEQDCSGGDFKKIKGIDDIEKMIDPLKDCRSGNLLTAVGIGRANESSDGETP